MKTLLQNGTVVTATDMSKQDVLIDGEQIAMIGNNLAEQIEAEHFVDATGMYLLPGGIDVHTHLDMPFGGTFSSDDFYTGHVAAAFGGTTTHVDFSLQTKGDTLRNAIREWHGKAEGKAVIDYGFHVAITDLRDDVMDEIPLLADEGVTSLKLFMAYKDVLQVDDATLFKTMQLGAEHNMLTMVHAENGDVIDTLIHQHLTVGNIAPKYHAVTRPALAESEATGRAIAMAGLTGGPLFVVHMSCEESIEQLVLGRQKGFPVMGETCVQYMFIFEKDLDQPGHEGAKYVCSPPVRQPKDAPIIWQALADGTLQSVSTDHCPFPHEGGRDDYMPGKELGIGDFSKIPNGVPGLEDRMMVIWHHGVGGGHFNASRFVEITATNPAKIFGMYPKKGTIAVGSDADILVWDPNAAHTISAKTHHMHIDYNLYEGMAVAGKPRQVYIRGNLVVDGDELKAKKGTGQFIKRGKPVLI